MKRHEGGPSDAMRVSEILVWSGLFVGFLVMLGCFLRLLVPGPGM
jgi:hypothetical protein